MNPSTAHATVLVDELIAGGVTDVVLCPGSRSAPLAFALHAADAAGRIRLHVRVDERGAGFLALGLARGSSRPVAVVTTSGTAVANLHPAVLEAHHGGVPLVVLSADRPPHLRGVGANQVIDQRAVFGGALRHWHEFAVASRRLGQNAYWRGQMCRALAAARGLGGMPGPVQLNVPFDVPLVPDGAIDDVPRPDLRLIGAPGPGASAHDVPRPDRTTALSAEQWPESLAGRDGPWTVIAGTGLAESSGHRAVVPTLSGDVLGLSAGAPSGAWGPDSSGVPMPAPGEKCLFLADLGHPWAAPLAAAGHLVVGEAGGLGGAAVLGAGMLLLADEEFLGRHTPDRVIVLGRPTLFRSVTALLGRPGVVVDVVDWPERYADLSGSARSVSPTLAAPATTADWAAEAAATDAAPADAAPAASAAATTADWPAAAAAGAAPAPAAGTAWHQAWRDADAAAAAAAGRILADGDIAHSATLAKVFAGALPDGATAFVGSSQPPRDLARFAPARDGIRVVANRGVAGIDGAVSTAIGIALAASGQPTAEPPAGTGSSAAGPLVRTGPFAEARRFAGEGHGPSYALLGDLTFLHDVTALAIGPHEPRPDLTIVVANNDGGGIFHALEQGEPQHAGAFERVFGTPTGAQIAQLAEAFGVEHVLATTADELADELREPPLGLRIVEVPVGRTDLRQRDGAIADAVRAALAQFEAEPESLSR